MDAADAPVRTFLIADIRGYTRFTHEQGDEAAARLASSFAEVAGAAVAAHDGDLIELRGDEALAVFTSARRALRAAVELQRTCREPRDDGPAVPLGVGIGLDVGEAVPLAGGGFRGGALNLAARLCSLAAGGEILASESVVHLARHVDGLRFVPRKAERLKGIADPVRVVEVVPESPLPPLPEPASVRRRSRVGLAAAGIAVALAALAALLGILLTRSGGAGATGLAANSAGLLSSDGHVAAQVALPGRPAGIAVGEGATWITDSGNQTLLRVDPQKEVVVDRIGVGAGASGVAVGGGSVWVSNSDEGTVSQINPETDGVVDTVRVGNGPTSIAYGSGTVWVLNVVDATVTAIAPGTGTARTTTIPLGQNPTRLAYGDGAVWITSQEAGTLLRLDPQSKAVVQAVPVGNGPVGVAVGNGSVWVANTPDRTLSRVDPTSGAVSKIALPERPAELTVAGGEVWAANTLDGTISVVDARTGHVTRTVMTNQGPTGLAASGDRVWALALAASETRRGGTLRVVAQGGDDFDTIDPGGTFRGETWQLLSMVFDGLLTYRRTDGPSGQTVVPDLAAALPVVLDGGRTYVFRLRKGIRFSDGSPVRATDVRAAIVRQFRVQQGLSFFVSLVGAEHCPGRSCDLRRGVVADDAAGAVTFHLPAPDPDFVFKLALPPAAVVPRDSPSMQAAKRPLLGTGPYRIARFTPQKLVVLTRNPHFHEWSSDAQPAGYPDRIVYRFGDSPSAETTSVERGAADVMLDSPPSTRLREIETRFPTLAHRFVEPTVFYLFLNTRIPPFDDVRVRKALNYATDRNELVRLWGGPSLARPTCQVLPPGIAGYRPYCPYTAGSSRAGNWTAPDIVRARALIRAAGGAHGTPLIVASADRAPIARYFVGLLGRLGYKTRLRIYPTQQAFYEASGKPSTHAAAGIGGWETSFPRASDFFPNLVTCASFQPDAPVNINAGGFCDRALDRQILRARALAATDPAASAALWSEIDRKVTDAAPWVAFLNRAGIYLTSARAGNYQRNPQLSVLLDQLWVR